MSMMSEFKAFAMRGNVVDMAVGVVIGGAFGKIISSVVDDLIMPIVGVVTGGVDFSALKLTLHGDAALGVGKFIQTVVDFAIVAFVLFMIIKAINVAKRKQEAPPAAPAEPPADVKLLAEIRDLLARR
jgi:large conductance mechanosensitive channel